MYNLIIKPIVKKMDAEKASRVALRYFKFLGMIPGGRLFNRIVHNNKASGIEREVFGLDFYNPLGLGAGFDTQGEMYNDLNDLGFSFSEIGPMGAEGVRKAVRNLQIDPQDDILAVCINKEWTTSFTLAYDFFDFFVIDLSSKLDISILDPLLDTRLTYEEYKPIVVKIPDELSIRQLEQLCDFCLINGIDGIQARNMEQIEYLVKYSKGRIPLIANCHIKTPQEAQDLLDAGAALIEVRSGFAYEGPSLVSKTLKFIEANAKKHH